MMINDLLDTTRHRLELLRPRSAADIRRAQQPIVGFSFGMTQHIDVLRGFLQQRMYKHTKVNRICAKARHIVKDLFAFFMAEPSSLPNGWFDLLQAEADPAAAARHHRPALTSTVRISMLSWIVSCSISSNAGLVCGWQPLLPNGPSAMPLRCFIMRLSLISARTSSNSGTDMAAK